MSRSRHTYRDPFRRNQAPLEEVSVKKTLIYMGILVLLFFAYIFIQEHRQPAEDQSRSPAGTIALSEYLPGESNPGLLKNPDGHVTLVMADQTGSEVKQRMYAGIADTQPLRSAGLSNIESFTPQMEGMLFVFPSDTDASFWMKDMRFALSIAFISAEGQIMEIIEMPLCEQEDQQYCPLYRPAQMYRYALEVSAGWFTENRIDPGDRIFLQTN